MLELVNEEIDYVQKVFQVVLNKPTLKFQVENKMFQSLLEKNSKLETYLSVGTNK